jgi:hypothetical protein
MKELERLAHDWVRNGEEAWIDDGYAPHENSFITGFRVARHMAANVCHPAALDNEPISAAYRRLILSLGESESST